MTMEKLFVYGTLQNKEVQQALIGRTVQGKPDELTGYRIDSSLLPPYPVAMPDEDGTVTGQVLKLSPDELTKLDTYEGDGYLRIRVYLVSEQEVWVYIGNPQYFLDETI